MGLQGDVTAAGQKNQPAGDLLLSRHFSAIRASVPENLQFLFLKLVCRARRRGFLLEGRAMLQAVRSARSARRARGACEEIFFPICFNNVRLRPWFACKFF